MTDRRGHLAPHLLHRLCDQSFFGKISELPISLPTTDPPRLDLDQLFALVSRGANAAAKYRERGKSATLQAMLGGGQRNCPAHHLLSLGA
jgi:hypothetical protein